MAIQLHTTGENALDSLKRLYYEIQNTDRNSIAGLKGVLMWGWHSIALLAFQRLQPSRQMYDAWVQDYLREGTGNINVERDVSWDEKHRLSLLELIDILSDANLSSLKPEFYLGWTDRKTRCQELRRTTFKIIGYSINESNRENLLILLAVYQRLLVIPSHLSLDSKVVWDNLYVLLELGSQLVDLNSPEAPRLKDLFDKCRRAI